VSSIPDLANGNQKGVKFVKQRAIPEADKREHTLQIADCLHARI